MNDLVPRETDEDAKEWAGDPKKMGFLDHLEELRWSLIKPLAVFIVGFVVAMIFIQDVKDLLLYPLHATDAARESVQAFDGLATRNLTGVYSAMLHIGLIVGVAVASPFFIYYVGTFLAPALTKKERSILIPCALGVFFFFLIGCSFSFFLLLPKAIAVTVAFNEMLGFQIIWSPDSYFSFITWIVIGMGVAFQFPLAAVVLVYLDILTVENLRKWRRMFILCFFIASAILTPPDPVTQSMMAVPMILLYELSILVAAYVTKRKRAKERESE